MNARRRFIQILPAAAGAAWLAACSKNEPTPAPAAAPAPAPAPPPAPAPATAATAAEPAASGPVAETEATAMALGYVTDASRVDASKYPSHAAGQTCGTCALFGGQPGAAAGPCSIFQNREVSAKGWCISWAKKA